MSLDKRRALIEILAAAPRPVPGEELAAQLRVSTRSIRTYVATLNRRGSVVLTSHRGYSLDPRGREHLAALRQRASQIDTPEHRLQYLCRRLAQASDPLSIHDLADRLFVSQSTLQADLTRAREVLREHELVLRRDRHLIWLEGSERSRRRVVRHTMQQSRQGLVPTWQAFTQEYPHLDLGTLRRRVAQVVAENDLELSEYALADLLLHLAVTGDRIREGHPLPAPEWPLRKRDTVIDSACRAIAGVVADVLGVRLPGSELDALYGILVVRATRADSAAAAEAVIDPQFKMLVSETLDLVAAKYLLGPGDPSMLLKTTLHVQNLVARARSGLSLTHPLGTAFKDNHPLIHDLALDFAQRLEQRLGITVPPAEVDYLTLHMGMQYLTYLEQRDLLTITLVVPHYYDLRARVTGALTAALRGRAVIERVLTALEYDPAEVSSDLVVSCGPACGEPAAPVVTVSPLLSRADLEQVSAAVAAELDRNIRRRIRTTLFTLIDPSLFLHVPSVATKETALEMMAARMAGEGYVGEDFLAGVLDREERSATSFGGNFAIPHSMRMDAEATAISVLVSDKGIPWGATTVRLVLLFALSPDGRQAFRDGLDQLIKLLAEPANIAALLAAGTSAESFLAALGDVLDR